MTLLSCSKDKWFVVEDVILQNAINLWSIISFPCPRILINFNQVNVQLCENLQKKTASFSQEQSVKEGICDLRLIIMFNDLYTISPRIFKDVLNGCSFLLFVSAAMSCEVWDTSSLNVAQLEIKVCHQCCMVSTLLCLSCLFP